MSAEEYKLLQELMDKVVEDCKELAFDFNKKNIHLPDKLSYEFNVDGTKAEVTFNKIRPKTTSEIIDAISGEWLSYYEAHKDEISYPTYKSMKGHIKRGQFEVFINYCNKHNIPILDKGKLYAMLNNNCMLDGTMTVSFMKSVPVTHQQVCINYFNNMKVLSKGE